MSPLPSSVTELLEVLGRLGREGAGLARDHLELAALELREAKLVLAQILVLACVGTALCLFALGLLLAAGAFALPPQWRPYGLAAMAGVCLLAGLASFFSLKKRLSKSPLAFSQTLAELEKDKTCF